MELSVEGKSFALVNLNDRLRFSGMSIMLIEALQRVA